MFKLVILCVFDILTRQESEVHTMRQDFETSAQAELRALLWLQYRPNDIVMLEFSQIDTCRHCKLPIEEKLGWVLHRWVHSNGQYYTCLNDDTKQAEPPVGEAERSNA